MRANGIVSNVGGFLRIGFIGSQAMIEKIPLPADGGLLGGIGFPLTNQFSHDLIPAKSDQGVQVIRHQKNQMQIPFPMIVVMFRRFQE